MSNFRFNLTLEILLADRVESDHERFNELHVSISRLRFFSLIARPEMWRKRRNESFNLTLEILLADRRRRSKSDGAASGEFQSHA